MDWQQAVSKDRIPFLQQDVVDLVISTMTINADREQQIDFSNVYYLAGQSLLVPKDSPIKSYKDLAGKNVCSAKGSTSEANVRKYAPQANVILFDSYSECVTAMQGKRADAVTTDDNILLGFASQDKNLTLVGGQFTAEPYGIGIKKGNPETVELVNGVLKDAQDVRQVEGPLQGRDRRQDRRRRTEPAHRRLARDRQGYPAAIDAHSANRPSRPGHVRAGGFR